MTKNIAGVLEAILSEYKSRVAEIQSRSAAENTFLQIHITALSAILTGIISFPQNGQWLIFLIPLESSLFGLWWIGNSSSIVNNGRYIRQIIEPKINKLLGHKNAMYWETYIYTSRELPQSSETPVENLIFITFMMPSILSILMGLIFVALSIAQQFKIQSLLEIAQYTPYYRDESLIIASLCLCINIFVSLQVKKKIHELGKKHSNIR